MKLYKFKSLEGDGFLHSLDMIVNDRIYLFTCDSMNDPYEGAWSNCEAISDLMNDGYIEKVQKLRNLVDSVRFTCFTESYNNELLWAHYAGGFTGVCFEYDLDEAKYDIRKVNCDGKVELTIEEIDQVIEGKQLPQDVGILKSKSACWGYESEYRLYQDIGSNDVYIYSKPSKIIFGGRSLKYDDVFMQVVRKYEIKIAYLSKENGEHTIYDV
jgi:hypothetical protein